MDPLSITAACVGLLSGIATLSQGLTKFVAVARQARKDVDGFSRELSSLSLCVSTLKDEKFRFPDAIRHQLLAVLSNCGSVIQDMTRVIDIYKAGHFVNQLQWSVSDRNEVCRLRERLEAHKAVLEITLELASLTVVTNIKEDTTEIKAELAALKWQVLQIRDTETGPNFVMQSFLQETVAYTESVIDPFEDASVDEHAVLVAETGESAERDSSLEEEIHPSDVRSSEQIQQQQSHTAEIEPSSHDAVAPSQPAAESALLGQLTSGSLCQVITDHSTNSLSSQFVDEQVLVHPPSTGRMLSGGRIAFIKYLLTSDHVDHERTQTLMDKSDINLALTQNTIMHFGRKPHECGRLPVSGDTALHIIASRPRLAWLIPILGNRGANVNVKNIDGQTPLDVVLSSYMWKTEYQDCTSYANTIRALRQIGAKPTYGQDKVRWHAGRKLRESLIGNRSFATDFASRHGRILNIPVCSHIIRSCRQSDCARWGQKIRIRNRNLVRAFEDEMVNAVFGDL